MLGMQAATPSASPVSDAWHGEEGWEGCAQAPSSLREDEAIGMPIALTPRTLHFGQRIPDRTKPFGASPRRCVRTCI